MKKSWEDTELFQALKQRNDPDAELVRATIQSVMPDIDMLLAKSATGALDFTLHDSDHSFRVASTMHRLMTAKTEAALSLFELALLLLSAYLHDIGMSPQYGRVASVRNYFLTGKPDGLEAPETAEIERWLNDRGEDISAVRNAETPISERNALSAEFTMHYCRHRHNEWSSEWIRRNFSGKTLSSYAGWVDDLIALCASHHYGHDTLREDRFNPHLVSSPARRVHLRYLACLLRLADVLEFDPERVPAVILRQRNVAQGSLIYWWKDAEISSDVRPNSMLVSARPPSAQIQFAIYETFDQVDDELRLCRQLDNETHFVQVPGGAEEAFRWTAPSAVSRDVLPRDNAYVYINGAFRPDTKKLLHLLSGIELYGNPLAAVRELLQNAFDSVREQIAYERLSKDDPANPDFEDQIANLHQVDLRVDADEQGAILTCTDDGVGMNLRIIENHFLVSGSPRRHDIAELEKRCNKHGFSTERTGKFGIGVLSYFMIGESVKVETVRGTFSRDSDGTGWTFETAGIGGFGQLTRNYDIARGSRVTIRLRREVHRDLREWCRSLCDYLDSELLRIPCRLDVSSPFAHKIKRAPGWRAVALQDPGELREHILPADLLPSETAIRLKELGSHLARSVREARACVSWDEILGVLKDDNGRHIGRYRIAVPTFPILGRCSVAYFDAKRRGRAIAIGPFGSIINGGRPLIGWKPMFDNRLAWKGMSTEADFGERLPAVVDFDLASDTAGVLSVSRNEFQTTASARRSIVTINQRVSELFAQKTAGLAGPFDLLNSVFSNVSPGVGATVYWLKTRRPSTVMEPLQFPAISERAYDFWTPPRCLWRNKPIHFCESVALGGVPVVLSEAALEPSVIALFGDHLYPVYTEYRERRGLARCQFPPAWEYAVGIDEVLNEAHPLARNITAAGRQWVTERHPHRDLLPFRDEILKSPDRAANWIFRLLSDPSRANERNRDLWMGLCEHHSIALQSLWNTAFGAGAADYAVYLQNSTFEARRVVVLSPQGWEEGTSWREYLVDPGPDWAITEASVSRRKAAAKPKA